jgi:uncharacterized protein YndB with AHSA1/START domain
MPQRGKPATQEGEAMANLTPVRCTYEFQTEPDVVYNMFTARLGDWWPLAYTFSGAQCASAEIEPKHGGEWYERTRQGERLSWGKVKHIEPGRRFILEFAIGPDRKPAPSERSSTVEISFEGLPHGGGTLVAVEHRDFDRHGEAGAQMCENMGSPQGWPLILAELGRAVRLAAKRE